MVRPQLRGEPGVGLSEWSVRYRRAYGGVACGKRKYGQRGSRAERALRGQGDQADTALVLA